MTISEFANKKGLSIRHIKIMAPYINGAKRCIYCKKWEIPPDSKPIYIPDKRKYNAYSKYYCYVIDAISLDMDLNENVSLISENQIKTVVRELRNFGLITPKNGCPENSFDYQDYMLSLKLIEWHYKKSYEKTKLILEIINSCATVAKKATQTAKILSLV